MEVGVSQPQDQQVQRGPSEIDESLENEIAYDEDEEEDQLSTNQPDQTDDEGLSFKEISEEWKMISWFTESICIRFDKEIVETIAFVRLRTDHTLFVLISCLELQTLQQDACMLLKSSRLLNFQVAISQIYGGQRLPSIRRWSVFINFFCNPFIESSAISKRISVSTPDHPSLPSFPQSSQLCLHSSRVVNAR
jgi:hypothetical protein